MFETIRKHKDLRTLIGAIGIIKSIDGEQLISVDGELFHFITANWQQTRIGDRFRVVDIKGHLMVLDDLR
jgi:membrane protein implicated in regulation of membrane protease activity